MKGPENEEYRPIDCGLYDRLEEAATLKRRVVIRYRDELGEISEIEGRIKDLQVRDGAEWMVLEDGVMIRLDHILAFDGFPFTGNC